MATKAYPDPKPFREKVRLVILDLDCFLYPYDKTYRNAVLRAWREIEKEYGLPIFRKTIAQKLIEEAKEEAKKNPDDALCRYIRKLAGNLESKGLPGASVIGMLEVYCCSRKAARSSEEEEDIRPDQALDPPYNRNVLISENRADVFRDSPSRARPLALLRARQATSSNRPQYEGARDRSQYERAWRQLTRRPPR